VVPLPPLGKAFICFVFGVGFVEPKVRATIYTYDKHETSFVISLPQWGKVPNECEADEVSVPKHIKYAQTQNHFQTRRATSSTPREREFVGENVCLLKYILYLFITI